MTRVDLQPLQTGDVLLVKGSSWVSRFISWSFHERSELDWRMTPGIPSSHSAIVGTRAGELGIWEYLFEGGTWTPFDEYVRAVESGDCEIFFARLRPPLDMEQRERVDQFCREHGDRGYDYLSYVTHFAVVMLRLPLLFGHGLQCESRYWCTEYIFCALDAAGRRPPGIWPTPYTVEKRLSEGYLRIIDHWFK